jgi:prepilin-type N-terminal cleavage/methylation domain-containing protein
MKHRNKILHQASGFSLLEVMVVMAIIFIIASIATPPFLRWRTDAQLRGAASNLRGDLELAKLRAVRENSFVAVLFNANDYIIFVDNGVSAGDWVVDADEIQIRNGQLPDGVYIVVPTAIADDRTRFDGRGTAENSGTIILQNLHGKQKQISINRLGMINLQ